MSCQIIQGKNKKKNIYFKKYIINVILITEIDDSRLLLNVNFD